ncbi:hypothetical protein SAMN05421736_10697 [Evansella caseinilytica]|uniref:Permuted papain-like amidase YaeF/Yiix C92 family enzyme n=1 Tax=Evansella caseinilytica TaxID=1503961 RepID=A0A1H3QB25_9BACI|nr:hypothetical protein [Evansella caseinilytica]SDZ10567.1 hypothetical protein SAMN05421736_10697 [Evansella caseinilytica]
MAKHKIFILLTDTGTLFTRMIKLYTKKPYNHASISLDPYLLEVYSFGRKTARNPFIGGFVKENIRTGFFRQARCAVYSCTVTTPQLQKIKAFIKKIEAQKHLYRYNLLGLFAVTLNKQIDRSNAFFCSQFIATVLQECELVDFSKPLSHVTPHDLITNGCFQLVYRGYLKDFHKEIDLQIDKGLPA